MVGIKVEQNTASPSPKKTDKKLKKQKKNDSPQVGKVVSSPSKSANGAGAPKEPAKAAKSPGKKDKQKNFGKFGNRNALKAKNDVFKKMVKEQAVKENLSPSFLKKLDKCIARLPEAGKKFANWLIHDVKFKIKFLPVIEEVFKLIKDMEVLPLPAGGKAPKTKKQKKKEKWEKRKELKKAGAVTQTTTNSTIKKEVTSTIKKEVTVTPATKDSEKKKGSGLDSVTPKIKSEKRKASEVSDMEVDVAPESAKKKKKNKPNPLDKTLDTDVSFSADKSILSLSEKKKKKKKSLGKVSDF